MRETKWNRRMHTLSFLQNGREVWKVGAVPERGKTIAPTDGVNFRLRLGLYVGMQHHHEEEAVKGDGGLNFSNKSAVRTTYFTEHTVSGPAPNSVPAPYMTNSVSSSVRPLLSHLEVKDSSAVPDFCRRAVSNKPGGSILHSAHHFLLNPLQRGAHHVEKCPSVSLCVSSERCPWSPIWEVPYCTDTGQELVRFRTIFKCSQKGKILTK